MTARYHVLPAADLDLDQQADDLAREVGIDTALRFFEAARTTFEQIAQQPGLGESEIPRILV